MSTASTRLRPNARACMRISGVVSTRIVLPSFSTAIDGRNRRFFGFSDMQTAHPQPIIGTPCDVPLPSTVTRMRIVYPVRAEGTSEDDRPAPSGLPSVQHVHDRFADVG